MCVIIATSSTCWRQLLALVHYLSPSGKINGRAFVCLSSCPVRRIVELVKRLVRISLHRHRAERRELIGAIWPLFHQVDPFNISSHTFTFLFGTVGIFVAHLSLLFSPPLLQDTDHPKCKLFIFDGLIIWCRISIIIWQKDKLSICQATVSLLCFLPSRTLVSI